ncbi:cupin domain-containing protein [Gillisia sp. JM1]|uniref:cupin domain-containing protein n=1 Tax=Gillisia sp. JM1 TaxID=1283286 RepID=UPI0004134537|nr:cupin domain-containing protein [Gillisia sp. JM1]
MILLSGELHVTYQGESTQTLKQGNYAYGPAKKPHSGKCGNSKPCVLFIAFENPLDAIPINK